ncbi:histidine phosphatase family protein [Streptococcus entericus]|uniref:histidine phosphatase family protein n=1 Tax=Streptococcus entericus TaxID=155680 RepID=UPI00036CA9B1|nr:histidine phosphatase family protein [Streptococcus entericus]
MTQTLYLMRHGETLFNTQKRVQGWCDSPLTDNGIAQAQAARQFFDEAGIAFDAAYSSTQERATDTAKLVTDLPVTQLKGLKEMNFGIFEAQPEMLLPKHHTGATSFEDLLVPFGGEDIREVGRRVRRTIAETLDNSRSGTTLMVSHGAAMWGLIQTSDWEWPMDLRLPNCAILEFTYDKGKLDLKRIINPVSKAIRDIKE